MQQVFIYTSNLAAKTYLTSLKTEAHKVEIAKLNAVLGNMIKWSNVVENDAAKKYVNWSLRLMLLMLVDLF